MSQRIGFKIYADSKASDETLGAFADLAETAFQEGLDNYTLLEDEVNPYIIFTMLVSVVGTLAQKFLELSFVMSDPEKRQNEAIVKGVQANVWDSTVKLLAFVMVLAFKLRGTIENENPTDD